MKTLEQTFEHLHDNPPAPFNPDYDPRAAGWGQRAAQSMEQDGFYASHARPECALEWRRRYDALKQAAGPLVK